MKGNSQKEMAWARKFWESWNDALTKPEARWKEVSEAFSRKAFELLAGPQGCLSCYRHWKVLSRLLPVTACENLHDCRTWLWLLHNESREDKPPTPWGSIARRYGWEPEPSSSLLEKAAKAGLPEEEVKPAADK